MRIPSVPVLIINPADDAGFAASARAALAGDGAAPQDLQNALRQHYPRVAVHPRDLAGEPMTVWYVYRDGHWVSPQKRS
jgi:hypothetical protein